MTAMLGFLTVRHHADHGYFGGYLIVNRIARPLEFHCTMPVKPSRAQALLYGPTIDDFVCGEQIAKALTTKAKLKPQLVLTDCSSVLAMSLVSELAVARLVHDELSQSVASGLRLPQSNTGGANIRCHDGEFQVPEASKLTQDSLQSILDELSDNFELTEPFQRVSEALMEAHPTTKAA